MESKAIPTVTEHFIEFYKKHALKECHKYPSDADIREFTTDTYFIDAMKSMHEYAVLFAKYHREQQIKAIIGYINDKYPNLLNDYMIHKEDLENAYSEDNIK